MYIAAYNILQLLCLLPLLRHGVVRVALLRPSLDSTSEPFAEAGAYEVPEAVFTSDDRCARIANMSTGIVVRRLQACNVIFLRWTGVCLATMPWVYLRFRMVFNTSHGGNGSGFLLHVLPGGIRSDRGKCVLDVFDIVLL